MSSKQNYQYFFYGISERTKVAIDKFSDVSFYTTDKLRTQLGIEVSGGLLTNCQACNEAKCDWVVCKLCHCRICSKCQFNLVCMGRDSCLVCEKKLDMCMLTRTGQRSVLSTINLHDIEFILQKCGFQRTFTLEEADVSRWTFQDKVEAVLCRGYQDPVISTFQCPFGIQIFEYVLADNTAKKVNAEMTPFRSMRQVLDVINELLKEFQ